MSILNSFQHSKFYPLFVRLTRVLQLLSALSSLVVFSIRVRKLLQLRQAISTANGAIEGILAAAVAYTLITTVLAFILKSGRGPSFLRWILIALDLAFVGAFIAVAVLTSPDGGRSGPCMGERKRIAQANDYVNDSSCRLPLGTFITAIVSTLLHTLTLIFHEVKDHHKVHRADKEYDSRRSDMTDSDTLPVNGHGHNHNRGAAHSGNVV